MLEINLIYVQKQDLLKSGLTNKHPLWFLGEFLVLVSMMALWIKYMLAYFRGTLWSKFASEHRQASFCVKSQPFYGMLKGHTGRGTRNIERLTNQ